MGEYIMDIVTLAASRKYTDKKIMESGAVGIKPDWNQNDETAVDYVKNRPFYTGDPVETVLVEETTVAFADDGSGLYQAVIEPTFEATAGETYKVSWDGTVYECPYVTVNGLPAIGNLAIIGMGIDTGEPFLIGIEKGQSIFIFTADTSASHMFSISRIVVPVVKIDSKYFPFPFKPKGESYLTFSSPNKFILEIADRTKHWDGTLEYFASDETWTVWDGTSVLSAITNGGEYVLYLRGAGNTIITGNNDGSGGYWHLSGTDIKCIGNIENLLDYATVESGAHPGMANNCYRLMFSDCTSLTQAPVLPATTLADGCYSYMFKNCTNLTQAPVLPAITLENDCYCFMFDGCTNLTQVPVLPAITLADNCYMSMFEGCTSLKLSSTKTDEYTQEYRIPSSGNGTIAGSALLNMFINTGGTFAGTPSINKTYYLSSDNMIVRETEIATLNGYIRSMIDAALSKIGVAEEGAY